MTAVLTIWTISASLVLTGIPCWVPWYWIIGACPSFALLEAADHVRQIEIDLVARAVLHQRDPVAVANLSADRRDADSHLRALGDLRSVQRPPGDLNPPKPQDDRPKAQRTRKPTT